MSGFDFPYALCYVGGLITQNGGSAQELRLFINWLKSRAVVMGAQKAVIDREVDPYFVALAHQAYGVEILRQAPTGAKVFTYVPELGSAWSNTSVAALQRWGSKLFLTQQTRSGNLPFPTVPREIVKKVDAYNIPLPAFIQAVRSDGGINAGAVRNPKELRKLLNGITDEYVLVAPLLNVPLAPAAAFANGFFLGFGGNIRPYGEGGATGTFAPLLATLRTFKPRWWRDMRNIAPRAGAKVLEGLDSRRYPIWFNVDFLVVRENWWKPLFFSRAIVTEVNGRLTQGSFGPRAVHMALRNANRSVPAFPKFARGLYSGESGIAVIADDHLHASGYLSYEQVVQRLEKAGLHMYYPGRYAGWLPLSDPFHHGDGTEVGFVVVGEDETQRDSYNAMIRCARFHRAMREAISGAPQPPIRLY